MNLTNAASSWTAPQAVTVSVTASSTSAIPSGRGIIAIIASGTGMQLQLADGGSWREVSLHVRAGNSESDLPYNALGYFSQTGYPVISDGSNVRLENTTAGDLNVTYYYVEYT